MLAPLSLICLYSELWSHISILTTFYLEQGFGQDASSHADGLADVIARVFNLDIIDGQLTTQWHCESSWLWWLLDREQQDLEKKMTTGVVSLFYVGWNRANIKMASCETIKQPFNNFMRSVLKTQFK